MPDRESDIHVQSSDNLSDRAKLLAFLKASEASAPHSGRTLADHLIGTYDLLVSAGCSPLVCLGGGLHSIYGTSVFKFATLTHREHVAKVFGNDVEHLAWLFSMINRPIGLETGMLKNWHNNEPMKVPLNQLHALRLIEAANLEEQGDTLQLYRNLQLIWIAQRLKHVLNRCAVLEATLQKLTLPY